MDRGKRYFENQGGTIREKLEGGAVWGKGQLFKGSKKGSEWGKTFLKRGRRGVMRSGSKKTFGFQ